MLLDGASQSFLPHTLFCTEQRRSERDLDEMGPEKKSGEGMGGRERGYQRQLAPLGWRENGWGEAATLGLGLWLLSVASFLLCAAHRGWLVWWLGKKRGLGGFQKRVFGRWGGEGEGERRYIRRQFGWSLPLSPSLPFLGFGRRKQGGVFTNNFDKTFTKTFLKFHSAIFATKSLINF